ncbi:MAG: tRNA (adenosine(37)-N6)-dimethylallyltransferase MiaA, partial [Actinobacteria bacterium]|nr:tRNA (adenosine(37)-N6)-dimethylallyltransferase MiaA [Actinomycetota bacterium]
AEAITGIESRGHRPLLVGGTGLYVRAIVDELDLPGRFPRIRAELDAVDDLDELYERLVCIDPIAASRMERGNRRRIVRALEVCVGSGRPFSSYGPGMETYPPNDWDLVVVDMDAETAAARIDERFHRQLDEGFLEEVRDVRSRRGGLGPTASQALGYRQLAAYLEGSCSFGEAVDAAIAATRRFARRQRSWFARDPRLWHVTIGSAADIDLATRELVRRWS